MVSGRLSSSEESQDTVLVSVGGEPQLKNNCPDFHCGAGEVHVLWMGEPVTVPNKMVESWRPTFDNYLNPMVGRKAINN